MNDHRDPRDPIHREKRARLDLAEVRRRLEGRRGEELWASLEEIAETEEFRGFLEAEFPEQAGLLDRPMERRRFLQLMGASLALAGATACRRQPPEKILPYVDQPEGLVPGKPLSFASVLAPASEAVGVLVESHEGRPIKISGNPRHPASLGATDVFLEAMLLGLYDPGRSQVTTLRGDITTWAAFSQALREALQPEAIRGGAGLRILSGAVSSPSLAAKVRAVLRRFPRARWHQYEPISRETSREAAEETFGERLDPVYDLSMARVIVSLDADFLGPGRPGSLVYARQWAEGRRIAPDRGEMNRLYVLESAPTITGAKADHRLALSPADIGALALHIAERAGVSTGTDAPPLRDAALRSFAKVLLSDLQGSAGASLVVPGPGQPAWVHALAHALNQRLGNVGRTVRYVPAVEEGDGPSTRSLVELAEAMHAGQVEVLLILDANPAHVAPAHLAFPAALERVPFTAHLGLYDDETAAGCLWHLPALHPLETWSDLRAFDGTVSLAQPLIQPLYDGISPHGVLDVALGEAPSDPRDAVRAYWKERSGAMDFELWWRRALHDGVVPETAHAPRARPIVGRPAVPEPAASEPEVSGSLELVFRPDATIWDGRFAGNGWLQELPDPITKLTWDNAAWVSPALAERRGLRNGDVVELRLGERSVEAPVWIVPGQADRVVAVPLGYGRTRGGRVAEGAGFDGYRLRSADAPWHERGLTLTPTGRWMELASTQHHHRMEGRGLVRRATREEYRRDPGFAHRHEHEELSLYPDYPYDSYAWGMSIDLACCIGCNACTIACQAENNIPVVGKEQVLAGREMHWIRVDRYYAGPLDEPETCFQPLPCMHCEKAPCEVVCPVNATVHDSEGLNAMVYNRCVGTRYCSNNCPYKVRRFNFFDYQRRDAPVLELLHNPDVTVRSRGVMEKCTYCVQRISRARIAAKSQDRTIRDGEVRTACQDACPTEAIVFGDTNDPGSQVSRRKAEPRDYDLLGSLNTRPRTSYLAELRNPHPSLRDEGPNGSGGGGDPHHS